MLLLTRSEVKSVVSMEEAIEAAARGLAAYSEGRSHIPIRTPVEAKGGIGLFMPGLLEDEGAMGIKVVSVFAQNALRGLPTVTALMILNDVETGEPVAAMEAGYLTALRTGAASGVATKYLARKDAATLAVIGAGFQARTQIEAVLSVSECKKVLIYDLASAVAESLADEVTRDWHIEAVAVRSADEAVSISDIVVAATTSKTPVFSGTAVKPGTHINGIGSYAPDMQELDECLVSRAHRFVCDSREAIWAEAGDVLIPLAKGLISRDRVDAEVGDLVLGRSPGRRDDSEITVYKGVGLAVLDLVTAKLIFDRAKAKNVGREIDLFS